MIIMIPVSKLCNKKKKILPLRDFVIFNCTTVPKVRDLPNVMADIQSDEDGLRHDNMVSLAYQMDTNATDETIPVRRREAAINTFFGSTGFQIATMNILAIQIKYDTKNVYVAIDDLAYDKFIDRYIEEINTIIGDDNGNIVFTWNSVPMMKEHLERQLKRDIEKFDKDDWFKKNGYNEFEDPFVDSLEDDEYDVYLDNVNAINELHAAESNKEIRHLFITYARYSKKQMKLMTRAVKELSDTKKDKK